MPWEVIIFEWENLAGSRFGSLEMILLIPGRVKSLIKEVYSFLRFYFTKLTEFFFNQSLDIIFVKA